MAHGLAGDVKRCRDRMVAELEGLGEALDAMVALVQSPECSPVTLRAAWQKLKMDAHLPPALALGQLVMCLEAKRMVDAVDAPLPREAWRKPEPEQWEDGAIYPDRRCAAANDARG